MDPHESANVAGLAGIDYILRETEEVSANVFVMMPSCVPATGIDDNACTITAEMMKPYLKNKRIWDWGGHGLHLRGGGKPPYARKTVSV